MFAQFYGYMDEWLGLVAGSLGPAKYELIHQYNAGLDRKSAGNDPDMLAKAKAAGAAMLT